MNAAERKIELFAILQANQTVEVQALADKFGVSTMTIRRDLKGFEKQGLVTTSYGGAYLNQGSAVEPSFYVKSSQRISAKESIGKAAAEMVCDGDTIILDCGTTTLQIVKYLRGKRLTIITNSWPVVNFLGNNPKIQIVLAPGIYNDVSAGSFGSMTERFFSQYCADKVFIGTHGIDLERGVTVPQIEDAETKKALLHAGREAYLLADSSKFGISCLAVHGKLEEFSGIITDSGLNEDFHSRLEKLGINVCICPDTMNCEPGE